MYQHSSDFSKSVPNNSEEIDILPIDKVKLSDDEISQCFQNLNEEQLDKLKTNLIIITQILYKKYR